MQLSDNAWLAWQFDEAVLLFGSTIEQMLSEKKKDGKPKHKLEDLLGIRRKYQRKTVSRSQVEQILNR